MTIVQLISLFKMTFRIYLFVCPALDDDDREVSGKYGDPEQPGICYGNSLIASAPYYTKFVQI